MTFGKFRPISNNNNNKWSFAPYYLIRVDDNAVILNNAMFRPLDVREVNTSTRIINEYGSVADC